MHRSVAAPAPLSVPPGFRFHPTDEELLFYYLRKKVTYEAIDLDVIREVDLNKLEPWDLKDRCRIGTGPQDEWYFFSHKDRKYPTGTRTNRATAAGFWKATGRDKAIFLGDGDGDGGGSGVGRRIGLRKTLVFYTGRAPHGKKTDWIMHEYRLDGQNVQVPEDGWVVCRVFKKKSIQNRGFEFEQPEMLEAEEEDELQSQFHGAAGMAPAVDQKLGLHQLIMQRGSGGGGFPACFDPSMHLPQLTSPETSTPAAAGGGGHMFVYGAPAAMTMDTLGAGCSQSQNMAKLKASGAGVGADEMLLNGGDRFGAAADWSILDKLLASSHQSLDQPFHGKVGASAVGMHQQQQLVADLGASSLQTLPFHYLGCEVPDLLKFS